MPKFKYTAHDDSGRTVTGWINAEDLERARLLLRSADRAMHDIVLAEEPEKSAEETEVSEAELVMTDKVEVDSTATEIETTEAIDDKSSENHPPQKFSSVHAMPILEDADRLAQQGIPLGTGLRAIADELPAGRNATAIRALADRIDAGDSLHDAMVKLRFKLPRSIRRLLESGISTGRFSVLLHQLVYLEQERRQLWQKSFAAIAYPGLLLLLLMTFSIVFGTFVVLGFEKIFADFGTQLPVATKAVLGFFRVGQWVLFSVIGVLILLYFAIDHLPLPQSIKRIVYWVPFIGPIRRWHRLTRCSRLMALLTEEQVPLPEVIRIAADGVGKNDVAVACRTMANCVESGASFADAADFVNLYPPSCASIVRWGGDNNTLSESLEIVGDVAKTRMQSAVDLLSMVACPAALFVFLLFVPMVVIAIFMPMIQLICCLS